MEKTSKKQQTEKLRIKSAILNCFCCNNGTGSSNWRMPLKWRDVLALSTFGNASEKSTRWIMTQSVIVSWAKWPMRPGPRTHQCECRPQLHTFCFSPVCSAIHADRQSWTTFAESNICQGPSAWIVAKPEKTGSINGPRNWPVSAGLHRQRHSVNLTPIQTETANELFQEFQVTGKICQRKQNSKHLSAPWTTIRSLSVEWGRWSARCFKTICTVDVVCRQDIIYYILYLMSPPAIGITYRKRKQSAQRLASLQNPSLQPTMTFLSCRWFRLLEGTSSNPYSIRRTQTNLWAHVLV